MHATKDMTFCQGSHELHDTQSLDDQTCRYDLDYMDVQWLKEVNFLCDDMGQSFNVNKFIRGAELLLICVFVFINYHTFDITKRLFCTWSISSWTVSSKKKEHIVCSPPVTVFFAKQAMRTH